MSFDDYANHIYQKHRLAVALGILKSKPPKVTTTNYLEQLKSKVDDKMEDDDITVCSDDFLIDDDDMNDSVTILKDFHLSVGDGIEFKDFNEAENDDRHASEKLTQPENSTQTTYNSSQMKFTPNHDITTDITTYERNHNLNQNFDIEQSLVENIIDRNVEFDTISNVNNKSNIINIESNKEINDSINKSADFASNTSNMDITYYDSQKTVLYSVHGFTQNYTHYSSSQNDIVIPRKYIHGINGNRAKYNDYKENIADNSENVYTIINRHEENNIDTNSENVYSQNIVEVSNKTQLDSINNLENPKNYKELQYSQTMNMFSQNNDENFDQVQNDLGNQNSNFNNETVNDINITNNDEHKIPKQIARICNFTQNAQNMDDYFEEMQRLEENYPRQLVKFANIHSEFQDNFKDNENTDSYTSKNEFDKRKVLDVNIPKGHETNDQRNHSQDLSQPAIDKRKVLDINIPKGHETNDQRLTLNYSQDLSQPAIIAEKAVSETNNSEIDEEIAEDTQEIISYKVLGEFNKVKTYLNRPNRRMSCDGYSTDSGYRSDSQRGSNRSALQLSGNWLNQSGCCLYNYIIQCPLVASTRDITNEIAQVLSQLIDRLHDEENYPSFLEDILETVDMLLQQVYEGVSSGDSEFLKKDESIQRILHLNKSFHIQKHSIEKISNILETFHAKITETDATYELTNIDQVENISYIFHILEILLKKYLKNKDVLSQSSTQMSQDEDKIFKRSSITDIWRKKWNVSQKVFEGSREKKCVLKICGDVLNKIVVDCVNSYSLVAYLALKCFNSMQS